MSAFVPLGYIGLRDAVSTAVDGAMDGGRRRALTLEDALLDGSRRAQVEAEAWRLVRTALLFQNMPSFALSTYDGLVSIPPSVWGTLAPMTPPERIAFDPGSGIEDMMVLLRTVDFLAYLEGKFAMAEPIIEPIVDPLHDFSSPIVTKAADLNACRRWLEATMKSNPEGRTKPKLELRKEAIRDFHISGNAFDQAWLDVLANVSPPIKAAWTAPGAPKRRK